MTVPPVFPGQPGPPTGQQPPPPWDPRAASQPFQFGHHAGPAQPYPPGPFPAGLPNGQPGPMPGAPLGQELPQLGYAPPGQPQQGPGGVPGPHGWNGGSRTPEQRRTAGQWAAALRVAAVVLVALGLSIPFDSSSDWVARTTWAIFAIVAALTQLAAAGGSSFGWDVGRAWLIGAVGTGAMTLHWLLIALPSVGSNSGFCLTFGTAAAIGGMVLAPGRRW